MGAPEQDMQSMLVNISRQITEIQAELGSLTREVLLLRNEQEWAENDRAAGMDDPPGEGVLDDVVQGYQSDAQNAARTDDPPCGICGARVGEQCRHSMGPCSTHPHGFTRAQAI